MARRAFSPAPPPRTLFACASFWPAQLRVAVCAKIAKNTAPATKPRHKTPVKLAAERRQLLSQELACNQLSFAVLTCNSSVNNNNKQRRRRHFSLPERVHFVWPTRWTLSGRPCGNCAAGAHLRNKTFAGHVIYWTHFLWAHLQEELASEVAP